MFEGTNIHMIGINDDMSHIFELNTALSNGEIVSMPADRFMGSTKGISLPFLGHEARFPMGPFSIAVSRSLPVLAVNVMKASVNEYRIFISPLTYDHTASRKDQTTQLAGAYVRELERILNQYPSQWYNYYEFWDNRKK